MGLSEHVKDWVAKSKKRKRFFLGQIFSGICELLQPLTVCFKNKKMNSYQAWRTFAHNALELRMLGMVKEPPLGYFISTHMIICNLWSESPYKQVHLSPVTSTHTVMYKAKGNFPFLLPVLSCEMRL